MYTTIDGVAKILLRHYPHVHNGTAHELSRRLYIVLYDTVVADVTGVLEQLPEFDDVRALHRAIINTVAKFQGNHALAFILAARTAKSI